MRTRRSLLRTSSITFHFPDPHSMGRVCSCGAGSRRGLSEPAFETGLAESCIVTGKQCPLANSRATVTGVWISDHFAGIFERCQATLDELIHAKLFWTCNFDDAV